MNFNDKKSIFVLVVLLACGQQARLQEVNPTRIDDPVVNGHTGGPVEMREERLRSSGITHIVNGPTDTSIATEEEQRSQGVRGLTNGPTGTSVAVEELRSPEVRTFINGPTATSVATEEGSPVVRTFINGPTGTSVATEEELGSPVVRTFINGPTATSVATEEELGPPNIRTFINGPTGTSVATEEQESGIITGDVNDYSNQGSTRPGSRGVSSTDLEGDHNKGQMELGIHIHTADWSKNPARWNFTDGEWSLVNLPNAAHPNLPAPAMPGRALVVVTKNYFKKVYVHREVGALANVTLHYRFFLSQGHPPYGVPELTVYQVKGDTHQLLATETTRGSWSDSTLSLPQPGPFTIVFEGCLNKEGNEIALDDITISWIGEGEGDNESVGSVSLEAATPLSRGLNVTSKTITGEETVVPTTDAAEAIAKSGDNTSHSTEGADKGTLVAEKSPPSPEPNMEGTAVTPETTDEVSEKTETTSTGNNQTDIPLDVTMVISAGEEKVVDDATDSQNESTVAPVLPQDQNSTSENPGQVDTETDTSNTTQIPYDNVSNNELATGENDTVTQSTTETELNMENRTTDPTLTTVSEVISKVSEEADLNSTTDMEITGGENRTDSFTTSTVSELGVRENETDVNSTTDGELSVGENETDPLTSTTDGELSVEENITSDHNSTIDSLLATSPQNRTTLDPLNLSESYIDPPTSAEVSQKASTLLEAGGLTGNVSGGTHNTTDTSGVPQTSHPTTILGTVLHTVGPSLTSLKTAAVTPISVVPPGDMNSTAPGVTGEMPVSRTSWGIFQFFLVLCLLGLVALGFLYWRKKRRQDDEIPVFTRSSYADYHNPTFTTDDDSSFASHGGRHNYKSFE